jgi:hypothetical protein
MIFNCKYRREELSRILCSYNANLISNFISEEIMEYYKIHMYNVIPLL